MTPFLSLNFPANLKRDILNLRRNPLEVNKSLKLGIRINQARHESLIEYIIQGHLVVNWIVPPGVERVIIWIVRKKPATYEYRTVE